MTAELIRSARRLAVFAAGAGIIIAAIHIAPARSEGDSTLMYPHLAMAREAARPEPVSRSARLHPARAEVARIVEQEAKRFGVPVEVAMYHARRESGFDAQARNPRSTAKGTLQVIRGSHAAIVGRPLTLAEHLSSAGDPYHGTRVGMAHIAAAYEARPNWSADQLWRRCHVAGLRSCGTTLDRAAQLYRAGAPVQAGRFAGASNPFLEVRG